MFSKRVEEVERPMEEKEDGRGDISKFPNVKDMIRSLRSEEMGDSPKAKRPPKHPVVQNVFVTLTQTSGPSNNSRSSNTITRLEATHTANINTTPKRVTLLPIDNASDKKQKEESHGYSARINRLGSIMEEGVEEVEETKKVVHEPCNTYYGAWVHHAHPLQKMMLVNEPTLLLSVIFVMVMSLFFMTLLGAKMVVDKEIDIIPRRVLLTGPKENNVLEGLKRLPDLNTTTLAEHMFAGNKIRSRSRFAFPMTNVDRIDQLKTFTCNGDAAADTLAVCREYERLRKQDDFCSHHYLESPFHAHHTNGKVNKQPKEEENDCDDDDDDDDDLWLSNELVYLSMCNIRLGNVYSAFKVVLSTNKKSSSEVSWSSSGSLEKGIFMNIHMDIHKFRTETQGFVNPFDSPKYDLDTWKVHVGKSKVNQSVVQDVLNVSAIFSVDDTNAYEQFTYRSINTPKHCLPYNVARFVSWRMRCQTTDSLHCTSLGWPSLRGVMLMSIGFDRLVETISSYLSSQNESANGNLQGENDNNAKCLGALENLKMDKGTTLLVGIPAFFHSNALVLFHRKANMLQFSEPVTIDVGCGCSIPMNLRIEHDKVVDMSKDLPTPNITQLTYWKLRVFMEEMKQNNPVRWCLQSLYAL